MIPQASSFIQLVRWTFVIRVYVVAAVTDTLFFYFQFLKRFWYRGNIFLLVKLNKVTFIRLTRDSDESWPRAPQFTNVQGVNK